MPAGGGFLVRECLILGLTQEPRVKVCAARESDQST